MKDSDFEQLVNSVREAGRIKRGEIEPARRFKVGAEDVKAIRAKLNKSQSEFALMIGVSVSTLQNWEQGRRQPEGPARALLKVASVNPAAVAAALDPSHAHESDVAAAGSRRR
ncbi:MAG TPA: NadS family protein [Thermoanaerobaculia bacterium]